MITNIPQSTGQLSFAEIMNIGTTQVSKAEIMDSFPPSQWQIFIWESQLFNREIFGQKRRRYFILVTAETGFELYDPLNVTDKTITAKIQNSHEVKTKSNPRREFAASVLSVGLIASNHCKLNQPAFSHYCIFTVSFPAEVMNDPEKDQRRLYLMPTQEWLSIIQVINYPTTSQRFVSQANYGETP